MLTIRQGQALHLIVDSGRRNYRRMTVQWPVTVRNGKGICKSKYALPLSELTIWCPRNVREIFAQSPHFGRNLVGPFPEHSRFRSIGVLPLSVDYSRHFRELECSVFMSNPRLQNVRGRSAECPPYVLRLSNCWRFGCEVPAYVVPQIGSGRTSAWHFVESCRSRVRSFDEKLTSSAIPSTFVLLLRWRFGLRRTGVRTFVAASCCWASRAESVGLCPLAPDGRTAMLAPVYGPQAIAWCLFCRSARFPSFAARSCAVFVQQLSLIRISSRVHSRSSPRTKC